MGKKRLVIVGRAVPPLKDAPTWTKRDEQGMKVAEAIPTDNGVAFRLYDPEAVMTPCFVRYEDLFDEVNSAANPPAKKKKAPAKKADDNGAGEKK